METLYILEILKPGRPIQVIFLRTTFSMTYIQLLIRIVDLGNIYLAGMVDNFDNVDWFGGPIDCISMSQLLQMWEHKIRLTLACTNEKERREHFCPKLSQDERKMLKRILNYKEKKV